MKEIYKDIPGYENIYQVSNTGKVKRIRTQKILKPEIDRYGYLRVSLYRPQEGRTRYKIHRLVAQGFIGTITDCDVNHIDGNKENNNVKNLECVSHKDNMKHAWDTGLCDINKVRVFQYDENGLYIREYESILKASAESGVSVYGIKKCLDGLVKSYKGYIWRKA